MPKIVALLESASAPLSCVVAEDAAAVENFVEAVVLAAAGSVGLELAVAEFDFAEVVAVEIVIAAFVVVVVEIAA